MNSSPHNTRPAVGPVLYIAPRLPALSETFVYREVFALRQRGAAVAVASVRPPEQDLGDERLQDLAGVAVPVYGRGPGGVWAMLRDAAGELLSHPQRSAGTLLAGLHDALFSPEVAAGRRPKVLVQCLGGLALAGRVRPLGIRWLHAHMASAPTAIAMYAARQLGVPFSFTGHAIDLFCGPVLLREKLQRAAFIACISRWHREFYRQFVDRPDAELPVVRCGVDTAEFECGLKAPASSLKSPASSLHILAVGRLVEKKGFHVLIRAVAELARSGLEIRCRIIGDGPERPRLEALIQELDLEGRVELAGAMPNARVRRELAGADALVLPCVVGRNGDKDGIPVVLMEAMAGGVCVVAGDLPAVRELVHDGRTGLLVPPGDARRLARVLKGLLADPARRRRLAEAGRRHVEEEFSQHVNIDRLIGAVNTAARTARPWGVRPERPMPQRRLPAVKGA